MNNKPVWDEELKEYVMEVELRPKGFLPTKQGEIISVAKQNHKGQAIIDWIIEEWDKNLFSHLASSKSVSTRKSDGKHFLRYIIENELSITTMESYMVHLKSQQRQTSKNTLFSRGVAAKAILKRVCHFRPDLLPPIVFSRMTDYVKSIDKSNVRVDGFNEEDILKIETYLHSIEDEKYKIKMLCQYALFRYQGLRINECVTIKREHINFLLNHIRMVRKKGNDNPVPFYDQATILIERYLTHENISSGFLFPSPKNKEKSVSVGHTRNQWYAIFDSIGVKKGTIHFRHFLAGWVCKDSGGNSLAIMTALGHKNIASCQPYIDQWVKGFEHDKMNAIANRTSKSI